MCVEQHTSPLVTSKKSFVMTGTCRAGGLGHLSLYYVMPLVPVSFFFFFFLILKFVVTACAPKQKHLNINTNLEKFYILAVFNHMNTVNQRSSLTLPPHSQLLIFASEAAVRPVLRVYTMLHRST